MGKYKDKIKYIKSLTVFYCRSSSHPVLSLQSKNEPEASLYHRDAEQAAVPKDANMSTEETNRK